MISNKQLIEYQYYLERMTLFMNESHGFAERMYIFWSIMKSIDEFYDKIFEYYNILDVNKSEEEKRNWSYYNLYLKQWDDLTAEDYFNLDASDKLLVKVDGDGNLFIPNLLLDNIGLIFNCSRSLTIQCSTLTSQTVTITNPNDNTDTFTYTYQKYDILVPHGIDDIAIVSGNPVLKYVTLNNLEYLIYIKMQIRKQLFDGTREELAAIYFGEDKENIGEYDLEVYYVTNYNTNPDTYPADVNIYWNKEDMISKGATSTLRYMFINGLLTIESLGITYAKTVQNLLNIAMFANDDLDSSSCDFIVADPQPTSSTFSQGIYYYVDETNGLSLASTFDANETYYVVKNNSVTVFAIPEDVPEIYFLWS